MLYWCDRGLVGFGSSISGWQNEAPTGYEVLQQNVASQPTLDGNRFGVGVDGLAAALDDRHMDVLSAPQATTFSVYLLLYRGANNGSHGLLKHLVPGGRLVLPIADAGAEAGEPTVAPVEHAW
jgi:hypothetical protein